MKRANPVRLAWFEVAAVSLWWDRGYSRQEISAGLGLTYPAVKQLVWKLNGFPIRTHGPRLHRLTAG